MRCKLGFAQTEDGHLLALLETLSSEGVTPGPTVTRFQDENYFLSNVVHASLEGDVTISLIANVLLVLSDRGERAGWTTLEVTRSQLRALGLQTPAELAPPALAVAPPAVPSVAPTAVLSLLSSGEDLREVLMQAPLPVTMLAGPQHVFAFINPAYVRLLGRASEASFLGKPIREVLPELEGQCFLRLLDTVYRSGRPFVGREVQGFLRREADDSTTQFFFDFVYHPVRDHRGKVCGILCQASDVTERVLARQVSDARELQLYQHWAELEAIYKAAPVGMSLVDCRDYRYLRVNDMKARQLGMPASALIGRRIFDLFPEKQSLCGIYKRVQAGEEVQNVQIDLFTATDEPQPRRLLMNFTPVLDACGQVQAIASVTIDRTERIHPDTIIVMSFEPAAAAAAP